ncbi:MAG: MFS transporter [Deltaproteobacteria bacterium]|nr:MFS transporter [Deltaproteobacteria bacterium]
MRHPRSPWLFVPSLYFQQGLPVILVQQFSVLLYKKLGVSNEQIAFWTSLLAWPWVLKMLWGPLVDLTAPKRSWVLAMQLGIAACLLALGFAVSSSVFWPLTLALLLVIAFLSATHDIALDGYYIVALPIEKQAFFLGISNASFRLAMVFCTGALVVVAGLLERRGFAVAASWRWAVLFGAFVYGALAVYATWALPKSPRDRPTARVEPHAASSYVEAFTSFFSQRRAFAIVAFILVYRFGESMVTKMSGLFFLDSPAAGGLGFDTVQTGAVLGTCGVAALVIGGISGGVAVARFGVRACLWPMAVAMHAPNLMYVWAASARPGPSSMYLIVAVDQFAYGFGLASYMVYTMLICQRSRFQASHYAIVTALMALGAMLAGMLSGYLQSHLGYFKFFVAVCACTLPGMFLLPWLPMGAVPGGEARGAEALECEASA